MVWGAFIGTWYLAGREIDKLRRELYNLQKRIDDLASDNNDLKRELKALVEAESTRDSQGTRDH